MNDSQITKTSKFLSYVLRHKPDAIGLQLDEQGWTLVSDLIEKAKPQLALNEALVRKVVATNEKKRFALSEDGLRIRASQGHSIDIDIGLAPQMPPDVLYHGTATRFLTSIREQGLLRGCRQHVHLSLDCDTASIVGARHGKPALLEIDSKSMHLHGLKFFLSDNGVWLTEHVPPKYFILL
ncbi:MAG: RNA 2'-phosphotransferase [Alphaproteobacteria bacterium]|nr:RNA 2'-phosphotransferase [Alphaproteobacteria bacterium]